MALLSVDSKGGKLAVEYTSVAVASTVSVFGEDWSQPKWAPPQNWYSWLMVRQMCASRFSRNRNGLQSHSELPLCCADQCPKLWDGSLEFCGWLVITEPNLLACEAEWLKNWGLWQVLGILLHYKNEAYSGLGSKNHYLQAIPIQEKFGFHCQNFHLHLNDFN